MLSRCWFQIYIFKMFFQSLSIFLSFTTVICSAFEVPVVETKFGSVRGIYEEDENGQYFMYMGMPFGQPPKDNFFGDPVDPDPWTGIYEANADSVVCPQREEFNDTLVGNPNCLNINVFVPANRSSSEPLPVLFWIYGGYFQIGSAQRYQWGPEYLIRHNVIMVSVNYRVGPFGFWCLGNEQIPGNAGVKDVLKGLRWVNDNIQAFGGNPNDITIGGSSSGSSLTEFLILSPVANGLFQRGILESGSGSIALNVMNKTSHQDIFSVANYFGFDGDDIADAIQFLQGINHLDIIQAAEDLALSFTICVEPHIDGVEAFFDEGVSESLHSGNFHGVDILVGFNSQEVPFVSDITEETVSSLLNTSTASLTFADEQEKESVLKLVRQFYLGDELLSESARQSLTNLNSDYMMIYPIYHGVDLYLQKDINVFYYEFAYDGGRNFAKKINNIEWNGAVHADEIGYLFKQGVWEDSISESDSLITDRMTTLWTNFVKYGNPTPLVTELLPVKWLPAERDVKNYLIISTEMSLNVEPNKGRMDFWDELVKKYFRIWRAE